MKRATAAIAVFLLLVLMSCVASAQGKLEITPNNPSLVYLPGEAVSFSVRAVGVDPSGPQTRWIVTDVNGKTVCFGTMAANATEVRVPVKKLGWFKFSVDAGSGVAGETTFAIIPTPPNVPNEKNPYGVNFHLVRVPIDEAERECAMAKRIGIGWGRGMLVGWEDVRKVGAPAYWKDWDPVHNADKGYEWEAWDPLVEVVRKSGISPLGSTFGIPRWASSAPEEITSSDLWYFMPPEDMSEFTKFCALIAARYKDLVQYWEVGNEVDAENFWKGTWKSFNDGNDKEIIRDYVKFLAAGRRGFLQGNPDAQVLIAGTTAALPMGDSYRPFLQTAMDAGAGWEFDIMNTHYMADLAGIKKTIREAGVRDKPIWITEIGRWSTPRGDNAGHRWQIVQDITMIVMQQAAGAEKFFKYDFRDDGVDKDFVESNLGLVYRDFSPKPGYAAYATLIRYFADAHFNRELNVVSQSDHGWLRGYTYNVNADRNILWLSDAKAAKVSLQSPDKSLTVIDIMGNSTKVPVVKGKATFSVSELPFIVLGRITDRKGKPVYPAAKVVRTIQVPLKNPGFEEASEGGTIPGWAIVFDPVKSGVKAFLDSTVSHIGKQSLRIQADKPAEDFWIVSQPVLVADIEPRISADEYVTFSLGCWLKWEGVKGRGASLDCSFFDEKGDRTSWMDVPFKPGSSDWMLRGFKDQPIPDGTKTIRVQPLLGPGSGKVWFDDTSMVVKVWKRPRAK